MSLSRFLVSLIEERLKWDRDYEAARESHAWMIREAGDHGTNGKTTWTRDEIHEH